MAISIQKHSVHKCMLFTLIFLFIFKHKKIRRQNARLQISKNKNKKKSLFKLCHIANSNKADQTEAANIHVSFS